MEDVRSIIKIDGRVRVMFPWDWPVNAREPYVQYAVTVLDPQLLGHYYGEAITKSINWYGLDENPYVQWL